MNYYFILHNRLATNFFPNQLADMFAYEIFLNRNVADSTTKTLNLTQNLGSYDTNANYVLVYNFHNLFHNDRLFVFSKLTKLTNAHSSVNTISELYINAN